MYKRQAFDKPTLAVDIPRRRAALSKGMHKMYEGKRGRELYKYRLDRMLDEYDRAGGKQVKMCIRDRCNM